MKLPEGVPKEMVRFNTTFAELEALKEIEARRLFLCGEIKSPGDDIDVCDDNSTQISSLVHTIFQYNREDRGVPIAERRPIMLYINSPGGELTEGFSLVAAIKLSQTPIYTVNIGMWCSMAFLIGITGSKRYTLPFMTFLMHEASGFSFGKISNMEDKIKFDRKFSDTVVKPLVLEHSCMTDREYDLVVKNELYLLPDDALKYGFVDEIVTDINTIL